MTAQNERIVLMNAKRITLGADHTACETVMMVAEIMRIGKQAGHLSQLLIMLAERQSRCCDKGCTHSDTLGPPM
jgi:hypothetical protein